MDSRLILIAIGFIANVGGYSLALMGLVLYATLTYLIGLALLIVGIVNAFRQRTTVYIVEEPRRELSPEEVKNRSPRRPGD